MKRFAAYRKAYPDERNLDLIMIDAYTAHKLFDRVLASIDGPGSHAGRRPVFGHHAQPGVFSEGRPCRREAHAPERDRGRARLAGGILLRASDFAQGEGFCRDQCRC